LKEGGLEVFVQAVLASHYFVLDCKMPIADKHGGAVVAWLFIGKGGH
jgi:hypothetical protein